MNRLKRTAGLLAFALVSLTAFGAAPPQEKVQGPKMSVSCVWRKAANGDYTISVKLKNFESYEVWVNDASLDDYGWTTVGHGVPGSGTLEFVLTRKQEPVVIYIKTSKYGTIKFDLDRPE